MLTHLVCECVKGRMARCICIFIAIFVCFYMRIYLVYEICDSKNLEIYVLFMSIVFGVLFI